MGHPPSTSAEHAAPLLLGGSASPIGWWVTFIAAPLDDVGRWLRQRWFEDRPHTVSDPGPYPACLGALEPLESPWTRHLLVEAGEWTMHLGNSLLGGDPSAPGPVVCRELGCRVVVAGHTQRHGPGHETTALWVLGPEGPPPLRFVRTVQVQCTDGRWTWHEKGHPLPFERVDRYSAHRTRDRFDRALLVAYLAAQGIRPDEPQGFGRCRLVAGDATTGRSVDLRQLRSELGLA